MTKIELLQASVDSNIMMYRLVGTVDYLKASQENWELLKVAIKENKIAVEHAEFIENLETRIMAC